MIVPCQLYSQFETLSVTVNFKLTILSKITSSQPKLESQAGNSPHFNSQFDPPHLQTQTFQVRTILEIQYYFPKQHSEV